MKLKFDHITISGGVSVGKNTLMDNLKPLLAPLGWKFTSGGQILRDYAKEYVQPLASLAGEEFHKKIEERSRRLLTGPEHYVIEAWLSGFVARDLKNILRVLLICSNDALRVDRVANRDKVTVEQAKHFIKERERVNFKEWQRIYGDYNFFDPKYYSIVIDTYSCGPMETVGKVLDKLGYHNGKH
ncbi:cytidylate kinase family protein [Patescibacteria group bacterium]|nr:cytidylate kinase family protein [Patescibacteria group bacterium]MCL5091832.1 cytidylate kinase family protein [Patescibacteria group bacterium]